MRFGIVRTAGRTWRFVLAEHKALGAIAALPAAAIALASVGWTYVEGRVPGASVSLLRDAPFGALVITGITLIGMAVLRLALRDERDRHLIAAFRIGRAESLACLAPLLWFGAGIGVLVVLTAGLHLMGTTLVSFMQAQGAPAAAGVMLVAAAVIYAGVRSLFIFPILADRGLFALGDAWHLSHRSFFRLLFLAVLLLAPPVAVTGYVDTVALEASGLREGHVNNGIWALVLFLARFLETGLIAVLLASGLAIAYRSYREAPMERPGEENTGLSRPPAASPASAPEPLPAVPAPSEAA